MKLLSRIVLASLGVVSIATSTTNSYAGNRVGAGSFTLGSGYYHFAPKRHIGNTNVKFGEFGYDFSDHWAAEALIGFFNTDSHQPNYYGYSVNGSLFTFDVVYRFSPYCKFEPYIKLGPGVLSMHPNGNDADTEGNINGGVGVQYFFDKSIALRVEAKDVYTIVGGKNDYFLNGAVSFLFDLGL